MSASDPPREAASVDGPCDPAFAGVEAAFRENFANRDEVGGAVALFVDGRPVVDLWGGFADRARTRPWRRDTLVNVYSVGKGIAAMLVLALVERGELALDAPITSIWPEFGAEGKDAVSLRMLLAHQAGLPGVRKPLAADAMLDWTMMTRALAEQAPFWTPGEAHGYHVNTHGFLVGEPVRRRLGVATFSEALRFVVTGPRSADYYVGLPDARAVDVAEILEPPAATENASAASPEENARRALEMARAFFASGDDATDRMLAATYFNPMALSGFGVVNTAPWRRAAIPSTNGHGTARAVAHLYDTFLRLDPKEGGFVGPGLRAEATATVSDGDDRVLGKPSRFGLGFQLSQPTRRVGGGDGCFGHFGYGGTLGFADPEAGIAFAYVMNRPGQRWHTPRTNALVEAVYASLGRPLSPIEDGR